MGFRLEGLGFRVSLNPTLWKPGLRKHGCPQAWPRRSKLPHRPFIHNGLGLSLRLEQPISRNRIRLEFGLLSRCMFASDTQMCCWVSPHCPMVLVVAVDYMICSAQSELLAVWVSLFCYKTRHNINKISYILHSYIYIYVDNRYRYTTKMHEHIQKFRTKHIHLSTSNIYFQD